MTHTTVIDGGTLRLAATPYNRLPMCCQRGSYTVTTVAAREVGGMLRAIPGAQPWSTSACIFHAGAYVRDLRAHARFRFIVSATFHEKERSR
jgi:hypothetical protein